MSEYKGAFQLHVDVQVKETEDETLYSVCVEKYGLGVVNEIVYGMAENSNKAIQRALDQLS